MQGKDQQLQLSEQRVRDVHYILLHLYPFTKLTCYYACLLQDTIQVRLKFLYSVLG